MNNKKLDLHTLATLGLLIGIQIVLARFFSIRTPIVTIGFGFLPIVVAAMMYGPMKAGIVGAVSDYLGAVLFPIGAPYLGFTLTAFVVGAMYGMFFHKKQRNIWLVVFACFCVSAVEMVMNTYWLHLITGKAILVMIPARILKTLILFAVQVVTVQILDKQLVSKYILNVKPSTQH